MSTSHNSNDKVGLGHRHGDTIKAKPWQDRSKFKGFNLLHMMEALTELGGIMAQETNLLRAQLIQDTARFQEEKIQIANFLDEMKKQFFNSPEKIEQLRPEERNELKEIEGIFREIAIDYAKELERAILVNNYLYKKMTNFVETKSGQTKRYNSKGKNTTKITVMPDTAALSLSTTI